MAEMDPIIRDALKRSSQMQNFGTRQQQNNHKKQEIPKQKPKEAVKEEPKKQEQNYKIPDFPSTPKEHPINMLFKDKEQSIILLLVVLLMNEDNDPMLLMALMYLLI